MHETTPPVRRRSRAAVGASWTDARRGRWVRSAAIALVGGLFLAASGAFGTGAAPLWMRIVYWVGLLAGGSALGVMVGDLVVRRFPLRSWSGFGLTVLGLSAPYTLAVWAFTRLMFGGHAPFAQDAGAALLQVFPPVLLVSAVMTTINLMAGGSPAPAPPPSTEPPPPSPSRLLERLPFRLKGAAIWAVEAEDHYLRVRTSGGDELILLRLSDAIAELEGVEGARTHRSWWVARAAVAGVRRGDGRAVITLPDGTEVPVSRSYAKVLRDAGWW